MKVLRIATTLNFGGIEKVFELHGKFHRGDYELIFVSLSGGGVAADVLEGLGYRVVKLNCNFRIPSMRCIGALIRLFKEEKPDVVHTCGAEANFHGLIAAFLTGIPRRIGEEIGIPKHSIFTKLIFKSVYLTVHKYIAISAAVRNYLVRFEIHSDKVEIIPNPIDKAPTPEGEPDKNRFVISSLGRLEPIKNFRILLELLNYLRTRHPNLKAEVWLIGDGSEMAPLKAYANELGVSDNIRFLGFIKSPQQYLAQSNLFILPSFFEGFGLACIEAVQCGVPVIASNSGGMVEYLEDDVTGFLFNPHSLEELIQKVERFNKMDAGDIDKMKRMALARVEELFSPDKYLDGIRKIYGVK
jgi:glycosyltransferase involved in cell wall biosynthesis